jgi:hypothetical protein
MLDEKATGVDVNAFVPTLAVPPPAVGTKDRYTTAPGTAAFRLLNDVSVTLAMPPTLSEPGVATGFGLKVYFATFEKE